MMWIKDLDWKVEEAWRPWFVPDEKAGDQLAGYVEIYEGLTFVTIHGAGHMAPQWKRREAHKMLYTFINGESLPK